MSEAIGKAWEYDSNQSINIRGKIYNTHAAIGMAKNLKVRKIKMSDMYLSYRNPSGDTLRDFVEHVKSVIEADTSFPIIQNEDGEIIDGKHRLAKAMLEGHDTISVKRFEKDPNPIFKWE